MSSRLFYLAVLATTGCMVSAGGTSGPGGTTGPSGPPPGDPMMGGPAATGSGPSSDGWSLQERQYWKALQDELNEFATKANTQCRTTVTASYAQETFRGKLTAGGNYGLPQNMRSVCTSSLSALIEVCGNGNSARDAVKAGVHHIVCAFGPTTYALQGGVFNVTSDAADENLYVYQRGMVDTLEKSL